MDYNQPSGETMSEGSDIPGNETPPPAAGGMSSNEVCVPVEALSMPGEDEKMNAPEIGDKVAFQIEGKVSRIEGDNAYVSMEAANGKPLTPQAAAVSNESEPDEFAQLQGQAAQQGAM